MLATSPPLAVRSSGGRGPPSKGTGPRPGSLLGWRGPLFEQGTGRYTYLVRLGLVWGSTETPSLVKKWEKRASGGYTEPLDACHRS